MRKRTPVFNASVFCDSIQDDVDDYESLFWAKPDKKWVKDKRNLLSGLTIEDIQSNIEDMSEFQFEMFFDGSVSFPLFDEFENFTETCEIDCWDDENAQRIIMWCLHRGITGWRVADFVSAFLDSLKRRLKVEGYLEWSEMCLKEITKTEP